MFAVCCLFHTKDSANFKKKEEKKNVLEDISQSNNYV